MDKKIEWFTLNAWVYSLWSGRFTTLQADIYMSNDRTHCHFATGTTRHGICASESEVFYNGVIWLPMRNDQKARNLFVQYELDCINALREKIKNHEQKINLLDIPCEVRK